VPGSAFGEEDVEGDGDTTPATMGSSSPPVRAIAAVVNAATRINPINRTSGRRQNGTLTSSTGAEGISS
jgi:hypothetical protein